MQRSIAFIGFLALAAGCSTDSGNREVRQYTIAQFMNTEGIAGASVSYDDSRILFSSNRTGIYNAYAVPVSGTDAVQITDSKDHSIFIVSWFPEDNRFLYRSDQGGNEIHHLYLHNEDGTVRDLTPDPKARAIFHGWSRDGKSFFFGSNKRDPRFMDVYEMDIATFTPTLIYRNDRGLDLHAVSPNKRYVALVKSLATNNNEMYLYDRETKELRHLSPHKGDATYSPQTFDSDSRSLYYLTNEGSEFEFVQKYDLATGKKEKVFEAAWDVMFMDLSHRGTYRVVGINRDGRTEITVTETATGKALSLPNLPNADITGVTISRSEKLMTMSVNGSTSPSNLFVYNLETGESRQLTNTMNPEIDRADLVEAKVVNDPRVLKVESDEIVAALRKNNVPVEYVVFPDEGHGFVKKENQIKGYGAILEFLDRYLKGDSKQTSS